MTAADARRYGRRITIRSTGIVLILALIAGLISETRGDFANGLLFFMTAAFSGALLGMYLILFGLTWLFGGRAGKEIITGKKKFYWVAVKYALIIVLCLAAYTTVINLAHLNYAETQYDSNPPMPTFLIIMLVSAGTTLVPLLLVWFWSAYKMSKQIPSADSPGLG